MCSLSGKEETTMKLPYLTNVDTLKGRLLATVGAGCMSAMLLLTGPVSAAASTATGTNSAPSATSQQRLQTIISKGDQEITRRLATLSSLTSKISAATKLTTSDKTTLSGEVSSTTSGLTSLKTQLDGETTVSAARTDVQSIYNEYRVYALVAPKVNLVKVADDQQVVQGKLTALTQKLQSRITSDQQAGKDVSTLQTELNDMTSKTQAARTISANIENSVIALQPTDYNSNHALLSGDNTQLKTARNDDQAATTDAKNIVSALKSL